MLTAVTRTVPPRRWAPQRALPPWEGADEYGPGPLAISELVSSGSLLSVVQANADTVSNEATDDREHERDRSGSVGGPSEHRDPHASPERCTRDRVYVLLGIFSRYVVGWMVAEREGSALAARLIEQTCLKQGIEPQTLTPHSDRGAPMTSKCTVRLLADLGVTRSLSRPQVSDDNPFSETQFKTLKYHPGFPGRFDDIAATTAFCRSFFPWVTTPSIDMPGSQCSPPMTSTTVEPARSSKNANVPFALPGAGTRSDSSTEPRSPSPFHKRSGSTRRPRLRQNGLFSDFHPSLSQCR